MRNRRVRVGEFGRSQSADCLHGSSLMKNIQIMDGAQNATFSIFQATDDEFDAIFPNGQDMEFIEDFVARVGDDRAEKILSPIWERPILKSQIQGLHGTLFYEWEKRRKHYPATKREVDWNESSINQAQRILFRANR
jgi:hypothetical protein